MPARQYFNLKPLQKDTFTFTGNIDKNKKRELVRAFMMVDNKDACQKVSENAQEAASDLYKFLRTSLSDLIATSDHPDRPIEHIKVRTKTPESIREKTANILADRILSKEEAFNLCDSEDIKNNIRDIVGARIVLKNPNHPNAKDIIARLAEDVGNSKKDRFLKIEKIECYEQDKNLAYFDDSVLKKLENAENSHENQGEKISIVHNNKKTGYVAVHIDLDMSNPNKYTLNQNGYFGEIQLVGRDVSELKEVEDLCYKLKGDNDIKGGNIAYKPFSKYFTHYYHSSPNVEQYFTEYTSKAYAIQRKKEPEYKQQGKKEKFPTIAECGLTGKVPKELDFNRLNAIKLYCDKMYEFTKNID